MNKVLIIAYYFPPSGGPGVQRVLKFVRYLRSYNWEPIVLTVEKGAFPNIDESLVAEVPPDTKIIRTRTINPFGVYAKFSGVQQSKAASVGLLSEKKISFREKIGRWIRANVFIPDARVGWYPYAVRAGKRYIKEEKIDAILTSGPPHSVHLIGLKLSRKTGVPWIADFRDPWTDISFFNELPMIDTVKQLHNRFERKVLQRASVVTVVSPSWKKLFQTKVSNQYDVIYNGYDENDFKNLNAREKDKFVISYVGNLYESRNPVQFWAALDHLINGKNLSQINVRLIGNVDTSVLTSISEHGLDEFVSIIPYLQYKEGLARMAESSLLLLLIEQWDAAAGMIPGKLYEYLAVKRPVLGIGPPDGDTAHILNECNAGKMFTWKDTDAITGFIENTYDQWRNSGHVNVDDSSTIQIFSRKNQTAKLAELLNRIYEQT